MHIKLSPRRRDGTLTVIKSGDALIINGETFDFSALPEGALLPRDAIDSPWFAGPVERIDGELCLTLLLPHGPNPPPEVAFPDDIIDPPDGVLALPQAPAVAPEEYEDDEEAGDD